MESKIKIQDKIIDKVYELKVKDETMTLSEVLGIIFEKFGYEFDKAYLAFWYHGVSISQQTSVSALYAMHHYTIADKLVLLPKKV